MKSNYLIKINLGSGPEGVSSWINLDWGILPFLSKFPRFRTSLIKVGMLPKSFDVAWPKNLVLKDCRKKLPFRDASVDFIYSSHFLEHLSRYEAVNLLKECRRILRPSGRIRIVVPDIELLSKKYLQKDCDFFKKYSELGGKKDSLQTPADLFLEQLFGYNSWSTPSLVQKIQRLFIRGHLWMYDYLSLDTLLHETGFINIKKRQFATGETPDLEHLDIHKETSLFVEAAKRQ